MTQLKRLAVTSTLLAFSPLAAAQVPVPFPIGKCATVVPALVEGERINAGGDSDPAARRSLFSYRLGVDRLCSEHSWGRGWRETMELHLGEGAARYRDLIERAVEVWNETLYLASYEPLIEIVDERPENYRLSPSAPAHLEPTPYNKTYKVILPRGGKSS